MKAIIGLGNPGMKYAGTRHNIGFDAVTAIADKYNLSINNKKFKGVYADGHIAGEKVLLVQPQTFMNLSGECVREVADFYKLNPDEIIIICDVSSRCSTWHSCSPGAWCALRKRQCRRTQWIKEYNSTSWY